MYISLWITWLIWFRTQPGDFSRWFSKNILCSTGQNKKMHSILHPHPYFCFCQICKWLNVLTLCIWKVFMLCSCWNSKWRCNICHQLMQTRFLNGAIVFVYNMHYCRLRLPSISSNRTLNMQYFSVCGPGGQLWSFDYPFSLVQRTLAVLK